MVTLKEQLQAITAIAIEEETNRRAEALIRFWDGEFTDTLIDSAKKGKTSRLVKINIHCGFSIDAFITRVKMEGFEIEEYTSTKVDRYFTIKW